MLIWLLLVWSLGWFALPLSRRVWDAVPHDSTRGGMSDDSSDEDLATGCLPDGGLAAGRVLLLWGWTLLSFWLGHGAVPVRQSALLLYLLMALCALCAARDWPGLRSTIRARRRGIVASESAFLLVFLLFFVLRGFWPDQSSWQGSGSGEKPMDMALLSACARAERLPPPNPYAAGTRLESYYYLGHLQAALLTDAIGSQPRHTYNLMCATLPALCFSLLVSLCAALTDRLRGGVITAALVLCSGTLEPLRQWWNRAGRGEFHLWPLDYFATSRVIPNTINEYPWFTFSYADLHAHFLAMPLVLLVVALGWALHGRTWRSAARFSPQDSRPALFLLPLCGLALGALLAANTWDFPVCFLLLVLCLLGLRPQSKNQSAPMSKRASWIFGIVAALDVLVVAMAAAAPFLSRLRSSAEGPHLLAQPASPALAWLMVWGLICAAWIATLATTELKRLYAPSAPAPSAPALSAPDKDELQRVPQSGNFMVRNRIALAILCSLGVVFAALGVVTGEEFFVLFLLCAMTLWTGIEAQRAQNSAQAFLCRMALCGLLALLWSETTWAGFLSPPYHRQDTVFKFGLQAWLLLGTAAACGAAAAPSGSAIRGSAMKSLLHRRLLATLGLALLAVALTASLSTTVARARGFEHFAGWDAWTHLAPAERAAADWLQRHARDGTHLIEAEKRRGSDYSEFTRYTHATGIPTVVGPAAHTWQWGLGGARSMFQETDDWAEVARRKADVRAFYTVPDAVLRAALLRRYGVRYVVCGELERREYGAANVARVERSLPVVFRAGTGAARVVICGAPAAPP